MSKILYTPAAAIAARQLGVEVSDDEIDWSEQRHIFECPDCEVVRPKSVRDASHDLLGVVCGKCGKALMWRADW